MIMPVLKKKGRTLKRLVRKKKKKKKKKMIKPKGKGNRYA